MSLVHCDGLEAPCASQTGTLEVPAQTPLQPQAGPVGGAPV